jgi:hypothetical protein
VTTCSSLIASEMIELTSFVSNVSYSERKPVDVRPWLVGPGRKLLSMAVYS